MPPKGSKKTKAARSRGEGDTSRKEQAPPAIPGSGNEGSESMPSAKGKHKRGAGSDLTKELEKRARTGSSSDDEPGVDATNSWDTSTLLMNNMKRTLAISDYDRRATAQLDDMTIGGAFLRFVGPGDVEGVLDLYDPKGRENPRTIDENHVQRLLDTIRKPAGKRDHEAPIFIAVSRQLLSEDLQERMKIANVKNPAEEVPFLELTRPLGDREDELEKLIWSQRKDGAWLNALEVAQLKNELTKIRNSRAHVHLLNGNHRLQVMIRLGDEIQCEHMSLLNDARNLKRFNADHEARLTEHGLRVANATWRVIVFDRDMLTEDVLNYLIRNEHERPARGMDSGESVWWGSWNFETLIDKAQVSGKAKSRIEAINIAHRAWFTENQQKFTQGDQDSNASKTPTSGRSTKRGRVNTSGPADAVDDTTVMALFGQPAGLEMVLDCRCAFEIFSKIITKPQIIHMLSKHGASVLAQIWLSIHVQLYDVYDEEGFDEARGYISNTPITADGYESACELWDSVHSRPEQHPRLLTFYTKSHAADYNTAVQEVQRIAIHPSRGFEYDKPETHLALRKMFHKLGEEWRHPSSSEETKIYVSFALYARLPTFKPGMKGAAFFPCAGLPAEKWIEEKMKRWNNAGISDEALASLELLISRFQLLWTEGARKVSQAINWSNWYQRARGLHQIVLAAWASESLGHKNERLSHVSAQELRRVTLQAIARGLPQKFADICLDCNTSKSGARTFPAIRELMVGTAHSQKDNKTLEELMKKARTALKDFLTKGKSEDFGPLLRQHTILAAIDENYWVDAQVRQWFEGWEDNASKQMGSITSLVGWGFLASRYWSVCIKPKLRQSLEARHLLKVAQDICELQETECWAIALIIAEYPEPPPTPVQQEKVGGQLESEDVQEGQGIKKVSKEHGTKTTGRRSGRARKPAPKSAANIGDTDSGPADTTDDPEARVDKGQPTSESEQEEIQMEVDTPRGSPGKKARRKASSAKSSPRKGKSKAAEPHSSDSETTINHPGTQLTKHLKARMQPRVAERIADDETDLATMLSDAMPGHIFVPHEISIKFIDRLEGIYARRDRSKHRDISPSTAFEAQLMFQKLHKAIFREIESERAKLRQSIVDLCLVCEQMPYGSDVAVCWLSSGISSLKDIFVMRVAKIFKTHLDTTHAASLNEAVFVKYH
ncbi:hypothetical protein CTheo_8552 [Ceratobasidium theobromae]|uniref:Uncharacterized protein n=1 Tax=Ceratobasidium theobromae TaxID=1582974 RepID=A0A5N5Q9A3_9AGAM|nr:hypothetical protein CTheo_8552 [Ceratobasidium theobromae]